MSVTLLLTLCAPQFYPDALKLILGPTGNIEIPDYLTNRINALPPEWKQQNSTVPYAIYASTERATVDKLVARTHAKGEKAGRDKWNAVAKARYGRDQKGQSELGLNLLENYLSSGKNLSPQQAERWAGDYPLTVLDEAIQKLSPQLGLKSPSELVAQYPKKNTKLLNRVLYDIGIAHLGFKELRDSRVFWGAAYGVVPGKNKGNSAGMQPAPHGSANADASAGQQPAATGAQLPGRSTATSSSAVALASNDPKSVRRKLRNLKVKGAGRDKLVTLLNEIKTLKHEDHPHAFCFLLRSMFELSAKAYCVDHKAAGGPSMVKGNGEDKPLADVLRDITNHLTNNGRDMDRAKQLHGAMTELGKKDGLLSVTSMNQLIHNPSFSVSPSDISLLFGNIFPLFEEMNR